MSHDIYRQVGLSDSHRVKILALIHDEESPFNDASVAPPDSRAHLADFQIHNHHIAEMCNEVAENWQNVTSIECGVHQGKYPYIAIRIDPYNKLSAKQHDKLIESLRDRFPEYSQIVFYCIGLDASENVSAATQLYKRAA